MNLTLYCKTAYGYISLPAHAKNKPNFKQTEDVPVLQRHTEALLAFWPIWWYYVNAVDVISRFMEIRDGKY